MSKKLGIKEGLRRHAKGLFRPGESRRKTKRAVKQVRANARIEIAARAFLGEITGEQARAELQKLPDGFAVPSNGVNSNGSLETYWPTWDRYTSWVRSEMGIGKWEDFWQRGWECAENFLRKNQEAELAPDTLNTYRAALRKLHQGQPVCESVTIPERTIITKSRGPAKRDAEFQSENHRTLIEFCKATGLRLNELRHLRICDVNLDGQGWPISIFANNHKSAKGGRNRTLLIHFADHRAAVGKALRESLQRTPGQPEAFLFERARDKKGNLLSYARIPDRLNSHALRREFAQEVYQRLGKCGLPPPLSAGRLKRGAINKAAAGEVAVLLGHSRHRVDTVVKNYLR